MAVADIQRHRFIVEDFAHPGEAGKGVADEEAAVRAGPDPDGYGEERVLRRSRKIMSVAVTGLHLPIDRIFGDRP